MLAFSLENKENTKSKKKQKHYILSKITKYYPIIFKIEKVAADDGDACLASGGSWGQNVAWGLCGFWVFLGGWVSSGFSLGAGSVLGSPWGLGGFWVLPGAGSVLGSP